MEIFADLPLTTQAARVYAQAMIGGVAVEAVEFEQDDTDMIRVTVDCGEAHEAEYGQRFATMDCWLEGGKLYGEW